MLDEIREVRLELVALAVFSTLSGVLTAALVALINLALTGRIPPSYLLALFAAFAVIVLASRYAQYQWATKVGGQVSSALRARFAQRILSSPLALLERREASRFLTALTYDTNLLSGLINQIPALVSNVALLVASVTYLGYLAGPRLLMLFFACATTGMLAYVCANRSAQASFARDRAAYERLMSHYGDLISGLKELKLDAVLRERFIAEYITQASAEMLSARVESVKKHAIGMTAGHLTVYGLIALVIFGYPAIGQSGLDVRLGFVVVILFIASPIDFLMGALPMMLNARVSLSRLADLEDELTQVPGELPATALLSSEFRELALSGACFSYDDVEGPRVVGPLDLRIGRGEVVIVSGGNGSGKTTLAKLLCGLYLAKSGCVLVNGEPVVDWTAHRRLFAVLFSDFHILDSALGLYDWRTILSMPQASRFGLSQIRPQDERWSSRALSRGQRRRLGLLIDSATRAPIHILDEPGSDLDPAFKRFLYLELVPSLRARGETVIIVSHDEQYFHVADRLVKMSEGRIVEQKVASASPPATSGASSSCQVDVQRPSPVAVRAASTINADRIQVRNATRRALKWVALAGSTVVLLGFSAWASLRYAATNLPADVALAGLQADAQVHWGARSVPLIQAASARDAYRILGWVHARDRLWQMETMRRLGQGRLAEVLGPDLLPSDRQMRLLGLYRLAVADAEALDTDQQAELKAYSDGVNAYLDQRFTPLAIEFQLAGVKPEPWRAADSLVWFRLIALRLGGNHYEEALRAMLRKSASAEVMAALFPGTPVEHVAAGSAWRDLDWDRVLAALPTKPASMRASNVWVVDGTLTRSGKPLLANDPHLDFSAPILWYLASIDTPELRVAGATVPGVPYHVLGHNAHMAWGLTANGADQADLVIETLDAALPSRYLGPVGSKPLHVRHETIKVRGQPDEVVAVRETEHGPVLSDVDESLRGDLGNRNVVALQFLGLAHDNRTVSALRGINRAQGAAEFRAAIGHWLAPVMNIAYADGSGGIGMVVAGAVPVRKQKPDDYPTEALDGRADWIGIVRPREPELAFNPASHLIVNANERVLPADGAIHMGYRFGPEFRSSRIRELLGKGGKFTAADFSAMQMDIGDRSAHALLGLLRSVPLASTGPKEMQRLLASWAGDMTSDRPEPLIYACVVAKLRTLVLRELFGKESTRVTSLLNVDADMLVRLLSLQGDSHRDSLLSTSMEQAFAELTQAYGGSALSWRWGAAHSTEFSHSFMAALPWIGHCFNIEVPSAGGVESVNRRVSVTLDGSRFSAIAGPGYRAVYDLSDLDSSRYMIATGQSGNPLSPHYADLLDDWTTGRTLQMSAREAVSAQRFVAAH